MVLPPFFFPFLLCREKKDPAKPKLDGGRNGQHVVPSRSDRDSLAAGQTQLLAKMEERDKINRFQVSRPSLPTASTAKQGEHVVTRLNEERISP
jgi:hypothetical protein